MEDLFMCGAAKGDITPQPSWLPDLRGLKDQSFGGILDRIFVRVIALESGRDRALLVSFDLDKVPSPGHLLEQLAQCTGVREDMVTMTAVHTHTAPVVGDRPDEGPNNLALKSVRVQAAAKQYEVYLETVLLATAAAAIQRLVPARMGLGSGISAINVRRNQWYDVRQKDGTIRRRYALGADPMAAVDRTLTVLKFEDMQGQAIAYYVNYPVHCCILHTDRCCEQKLGISGDIAGFVCDGLEDGCVALWTSGAAGDINPLMQVEMHYPLSSTGAMAVKSLREDARELLTVLGSRHLADIRGVIRGIRCDRERVALAGAVEWSRTPGKAAGTQYEVRLHMLRLGDIYLLGASGELYSSYGGLIKGLLPQEQLIILNHEASLYARSGYIFDDATLRIPEADLPGLQQSNMRAGYFSQSLAEHVLSMYGRCSR